MRTQSVAQVVDSAICQARLETDDTATHLGNNIHAVLIVLDSPSCLRRS